MNRRGFLQRLMALPAALLGIKAMEKAEEPAVYQEFWDDKDRFVTWRATYGVGEATATEVVLQQQWEREAEHAFYNHGLFRPCPSKRTYPHKCNTLLCGTWANL